MLAEDQNSTSGGLREGRTLEAEQVLLTIGITGSSEMDFNQINEIDLIFTEEES